jgi:hypothetical protein
LTQEDLDEEYMGLFAPGHMMNDPVYGQRSYNSSLSNALKLKLGHDVQRLLIQMKAATKKGIAKHVMRLAKVIPARLVTASYVDNLIHIRRLRRDLMKMKEWWMRRQVGKRLILLM